VLARLASEGLVVLEPNRGARVRSFGVEEAKDVLRVREAIEGVVAALAATRSTVEHRARLHEILAGMERALDDDDLMRYSSLNGEFHTVMREAAGSPTATAVLGSLHYPLVKFHFRSMVVPRRKIHSLEEHRELLRAIEAGDAEAAEQAGRRHVRHFRATLEALPAEPIDT
jgi:DNA-binding GntR family transcriptional regulator